MSPPDPRRLFYDMLGERFEGRDHAHDVARRLAIVFGELAPPCQVGGALVLDAGCGYGVFSVAAARAGARIVSLDIAPRLVALTLQKTGGAGLVADAALIPFRRGTFDLVISSEMIEHTTSPATVVEELVRVVKPGGVLILTTPNRAWQWVVRWASRLRLRPFHGFENFLRWSDLEELSRAHGLEVLRHVGFHPWPFQLGLARLSTAVDRRYGNGRWARLMINQAIAARKPAATPITTKA